LIASSSELIHAAAHAGHEEIVRLLLETQKVKVNPLLLTRSTPLYMAARNGLPSSPDFGRFFDNFRAR
jgi:ankyrin repeat protein